jgi:ABC transporter substrate binding protein
LIWCGLALALTVSGPVWGQDYPNRQITILVGIAAGGITDVTTRQYAAVVSTNIDQNIIIENRPVAGGAVAAAAIHVVNASTIREIDAAFASLVRERADALFVAGDGFFNSRRVQLAMLAVRHSIPATFTTREFAEAGGLMSYGTSWADTDRQVGIYAGRILKGAKPADLPVVQSSKFEFVINLQAARMLGLEVPATVLARADEVIE